MTAGCVFLKRLLLLYQVPDRVNPPDHFMDVLGGEVESEKGIVTKTLPELWLQTQGRHKPPSDYYSNPDKGQVEIPMGDRVAILPHDMQMRRVSQDMLWFRHASGAELARCSTKRDPLISGACC